ncbi:hypothetical protein V6Z12_D03G050500 [Gossypium hirsutum]
MFNFFHRIEAQGYSGGIWLLWNKLYVVDVVLNHSQFLHVEIMSSGISNLFFLTIVYGSLCKRLMHGLWGQLCMLDSNMVKQWIFVGDWIVLLLDDEYEGPKRHMSHSCGSFQKFMFDFALKDIGFIGPRFTWKHGVKLERLDRMVCNMEWSEKFLSAWVKHLH